jgi:hypothetical protein
MQAKELEAFAAEVVQSMKMAMAPVVARVATLERDLKAATERASELEANTRRAVSTNRDDIGTAIADAMAPLLEKNASLELRIMELETNPALGPAGPIGQKGETGAGVASLVVTADGRLLAHFTDGRSVDVGPVPHGLPGPPGERGEPGPSGKSAVLSMESVVAAVLERLPAPTPGDKGDAGPAGKDAPAVDVDALVTRVAALVPVPKDGRDGKDGAVGLAGKDGVPGERGLQGEKGIDGLHGRDGLDGKDIDPQAVKAFVVAELATWPRPKDGADGRDARLEGLTFAFDGQRTVTACFKDGTPIEGGTWVLPTTIYRGVHQAGASYQTGDSVTWDGHTWIAMADTSEAPGEGSKAWQLSVRRGKTGKEGRAGKDGKDAVTRTTNTPPLYGG